VLYGNPFFLPSNSNFFSSENSTLLPCRAASRVSKRLTATAAVSKISCPVKDMTQYSFEDQLGGKQRKIKYMGIRYNCTGPMKNKGKNNNWNKITKYYSCGMSQERRNGP
jgi:hypothetical protein